VICNLIRETSISTGKRRGYGGTPNNSYKVNGMITRLEVIR
jgi:hypothetical protein